MTRNLSACAGGVYCRSWQSMGLDAQRGFLKWHVKCAMQAALDKKLTAWLDHYAAWHAYGVLSLPRADFDALPLAHKQRFIGRFVQYFGQHAHPVKQKKTDRLFAPD